MRLGLVINIFTVRELVPRFHVGLPSLSILKAVHSASGRAAEYQDLMTATKNSEISLKDLTGLHEYFQCLNNVHANFSLFDFWVAAHSSETMQ